VKKVKQDLETGLILLTCIMLIVTSADLLYLHKAGCWYDPVKGIESTEVGAFWGLIGLGVVTFAITARKLG
jgi:hypothetical protein